ncbi:MAG: flagellar FlbD family protein [Thermoguttaceae bacterium]
MIRLTRLNGEGFVLNGDLIRFIEVCPDTLITLVGGETLMVRETLDEVVRRAVTYQQAKSLIPRPQYAPCNLGD